MRIPLLVTLFTVGHAGAAGIPLKPAKPAESGKLFDRLGPEMTGLAEVNRIVPDHELSYLYPGGMGMGSLAVGDVDGDGLVDVFIAGGAGPNRLYRGTEIFKFEDVTATAGPLLDGGTGWATGCAMVDIEGDGDLDIFVCNYDTPCQLFLNMGKGPEGVFFREVAAAAQLELKGACAVPCFADYDRDGDLDLYIVTGRLEDPAGQPEAVGVEMQNGRPVLRGDAARYYEAVTGDGGKTWQPVPAGGGDVLLRNEGLSGQGVPYFRDVSRQAGIGGRGAGESAVWWDADGDGWLDLYVCNAGHAADVFYHNEAGKFRVVTAERLSMVPWETRAAAAGDFSGDGLPDLFAGGMGYARRKDRCLTDLIAGNAEASQAVFNFPPQEHRSALFVNSGGGRPGAECAWLAGAARTGAVQGAQWLDADQDGRLDLILLHGQARRFADPAIPLPVNRVGKHLWDYYAATALQKEPLTALRNAGGLHMEDATEDWGLGALTAGTALAAADMDADGDLDLVATAFDEAPVIYRNGNVKQNNVTVRLLGPVANPYAIGTTLIARGDKAVRWQQVMPCNGGRGQSDTLVTFCLGSDPVIQELTIQWPDGKEQRESSLIAGNAYAFQYNSQSKSRAVETPAETFFTRLPALEAARHTGAGSTEFAAEPLLPFANATAAPALAWTDVDNDGDYDFFLGGGGGMAGVVRRNDGQGKFVPEWSRVMQNDADAVDAGAVWFDADGDGDADLFIAGGSTGYQGQSPAQRDRLYLNDGKGTFFAAPAGALPQDGAASSVVCVSDYDRDGDFDLFCGARAVPGDYGSAPVSLLLRNDSGGGKVQFVSAASSVDLRSTGMVTSAVWTDLDNDGWPDLVIAHDWGGLAVYINRVGKRMENTGEASGTGKMTGWWQSLAAADVDGDGDMDLIAGNAGTNSMHRAPVTGLSVRPEGAAVRLFLMTEREGDKLWPQRSPGMFTALMPGRFRDYASAAAATAEEVTGKDLLDAAVRYEAATLQSGVFINEPGGEKKPPRFTFVPLPAEAQLAPVFGIATADFDGDGDCDVVLAQNARNAPPGEGQRDGGLCVLLVNDGKGAFTAMSPAQSGLASHDEFRACTVADLTFDGRPDVVMSTHRGGVAVFSNTSPKSAPILRVNLPPGRAPGARIMIERANEPPLHAEYAAGGGWLSQSVPSLFFGLGKGSRRGVINLRWADGRVWMQSFDENRLTFTAPSK